MHIDELNPHWALWKSENRITADDALWERWTGCVEKLLDIESLDGDQNTDGYSVDIAHDFFIEKLSPKEAAAEFSVRIREIAEAKL